MNKTFFLTGIVFGLFSIVFGAFGAHVLKEMISSSSLASFETGVRYQMYHALLLIALGLAKDRTNTTVKGVYYLITLGTICFSFSIYLLALRELTNLNLGILGLMTPLGGLLLIAGWFLLGYRIFRYFG